MSAPLLNMKYVTPVYDEIMAERARQDEQWGGTEHDDQHDARDWSRFLREHVGLLNNFHIEDIQTYMGPIDDIKYDGPAHDYRERLVKIAALAVAALESYDRKAAPTTVCQKYLASTGQPYPRSCPTCGLAGSCKFGIEFKIGTDKPRGPSIFDRPTVREPKGHG